MNYIKLIGMLLFCIQTALAQVHVNANDSTTLKKLVQSADGFMKQAQFQKALVQLQRARALDSFQTTLDVKIRECQVRLGAWVSGEGNSGSEWIEVDKLRLQDVPSKSFDSLFRVGQALEARDNFDVAMKIYAHLVEKAPQNAAYGKAYQALRVKLDQLVVNHSEVGEVFLKQGRFAKALEELNRALFFKPEDEYLLDRIQYVEARQKELLENYRSRLQHALKGGDVDQATVIAERAYRDFPQEKSFRKSLDSLQGARGARLVKFISECKTMIDKGQLDAAESRLREALVTFPGEQSVIDLLADVQRMIEGNRKKGAVDSIARAFQKAMQSRNVNLGAALLQNMASMDPKFDMSKQLTELEEIKRQLGQQQEFENKVEQARQAIKDGAFAQAKEALMAALALKSESPVARQMLEDLKKEELRQKDTEDIRRKDIQKAEVLIKAGQIQSAKRVGLTVSGVGKMDQEVKQIQRTIREAEYASTPESEKRAQEIFLEGIAKYRVGEYQEAMNLWSKVLKLNPNHDQAKKYVSNVKQKLSRMQ